MLGQERLKREILEIFESGRFPRFSIIVGERGSELQLVPDYIAGVMQSDFTAIEMPDNKVGTVREYITMAYKQTSDIIIVIPNGDSMSAQAVNALLKVTEEPPNNAYFIMLVENEANLLETIKSRAYIFRMNRYTKKELNDYMYSKYDVVVDTISDVCTTPGEIDILMSKSSKGFQDYVYNFVSNITKISGAKSFTLVDKISLKDDDGKYDIALFFKFVQHRYLYLANHVYKSTEDIAKCCRSVIEAGFALKDLSIKGINRKMLLSTFILNVRKIWK